MTDNKELLNHLSDMLDVAISKRLKQKGESACEKELLRVRGAINYAMKSILSKSAQRLFMRQDEVFKDVYDTLKAVILKIEAEGKTLNTELHGVQNYSQYELERIDVFSFKNILHDVLMKMLKQIPSERAGTLVARFNVRPVTCPRGKKH